jgi:hypothetical protein
MATGLTKNTSVIGIEKEVVEGTYIAPTAATSYVQPLADGFELTPSREKIARTILTNSIGKPTPRLGMRSVASAIPCEFRASGVEGADVDFALLLEGALGAKRSIASTTTTKAGNTGSVLQIQDADIAKFNVGDIVVVKEAGAHHPCAITAKTSTAGAASVSIVPSKASGSFSDNVAISKSQMYLTANANHPSLSVSLYWANEILQKAIGCKVTSLSVDNFSTGQVAAFNFALEGLNYGEADASAPHSPSYDSGIPPIMLGAKVFQAGQAIDINKFGLSVANTIGFLTAATIDSGKAKSRITERTITGSFNPYKDDTSTANMTTFDQGTEFSLFVWAANPSAVAGELAMGSVVGIYLPKCTLTEAKVGNQNGILTDDLSFQAGRGSDGASEEMFIGLI